MKVVTIGAHPDDLEIGTAGTNAKHKDKGDETHEILCTLGGVSGDPKQRENEAREGARLLGIKKLHILDYPISKLNKQTIEFERTIKKIIDQINPDRIYTHTHHDNHQVHVTVNKSVLNVAKDVKQIMFFETLSSTTQDFKPNAFVNITNYIDLKVKSIKVHQSQSNRFYMQPNVMRSLANTRYIWGKVGLDHNGYAEAFRIHKLLL
jgi:LmbE family N-acetylglucosaminyl deacetylase